MSYRTFHPERLDVATTTISGAEAHHLVHVLRCQVGEGIELFDGQGVSAQALITNATRTEVEVRIESVRTEAYYPTPALTIATAIPKGDRITWIAEKLTELGTARLCPLDLERSVVKPGEGKLQRLKQTVIAACKQSGRNILMPIDLPVHWKHFLNNRGAQEVVLVADPSGVPFREFTGQVSSHSRNLETALEVTACVGPEGGFTEAELDLAREEGANIVSLGDGILRIETAVIALASYFSLTAR